VTTETNGTTKARASVPQMLADLILFGQRNELPDPLMMQAREQNQGVEVQLPDRSAIDAWNAALGGEVRSRPWGSGLLHTSHVRHNDWWVHLSAITSSEKPSALGAETAAALEQVAA
jgi:hypothetical protein